MKIRTGVKNFLDLVTHPFGIDIERHFGTALGLKQILNVFKQQQINMLLDVGANTGQYARTMLKLGYKGAIISFEPLKDAYDILKTHETKYTHWRVYQRTAIGDYCGKATINISENSHSSSILPISETHSKLAPEAKYIGESETPVITLDSIFPDIINPSDNTCLKIDTQGFEARVLAGSAESLKKIKLIQLELSLTQLYLGSKTIEWMLPYLKDLGFKPVLFLPGFIDRTTGQIQELEGLFIKENNG